MSDLNQLFQLSSLIGSLAPDRKQENRCVVRLLTTMWSDKNGVYTKKSLKFLRRKCTGFNMLEDDTSNVGAVEVLPSILNLYECEDGVYEVVVCNVSRDWETGFIDYYEYRLVEYQQEDVKQ